MKKGIQDLCFSPSGKTLAGVAIDDNHMVAAYDTQSGACLGCDKGDSAFIFELAMIDDKNFCSAGDKHFKAWTIGNTLTGKRGTFGKHDKRIGSCKAAGKYVLSGAITGELYVWQGKNISKTVKLHDRPLDAIHVTAQNVFTGGRDGKVNVLKANDFS